MSKYADLKADLAVAREQVAALIEELGYVKIQRDDARAGIEQREKALSDLGEWSRREIQQAQGLNQHLAERNARLQRALELAQTHLPLEDPVQGEP